MVCAASSNKMPWSNSQVQFLPVCFIGFTHVHTPQFARGNVFANQPTQQHLQEQDKYKAYLKQQVLLQPAGGTSAGCVL